MGVYRQGVVCAGREAYTAIFRSFNVADRIFGSEYMSKCRITCVLSKDGGDGGEIWAGGIQ